MADPSPLEQIAAIVDRAMPARPGVELEPVGLAEIAERLDVPRKTVDQWRQRGVLPDPRWTVGGRPAWEWSDIAAWHVARDPRRRRSGSGEASPGQPIP